MKETSLKLKEYQVEADKDVSTMVYRQLKNDKRRLIIRILHNSEDEYKDYNEVYIGKYCQIDKN